MVDVDIVYVTYNSSKWINKCFRSLINSNYDMKKVSVYVVDNNSSDDSVRIIEDNIEKYKMILKDFRLYKSDDNLGFGKANNIGSKLGDSPIVCFFNIDTELTNNALYELSNDIDMSGPNVGVWELRQFPYEHPKIYNPLTRETSWSSGAAFAIRRGIFEKINGFDERIFMYAEDVDLSWRVRSVGYVLKYVPSSVIYHYSYEKAGEIKPNQYINSIINNLLLRYRFSNIRDILLGHALVLHQMLCPPVYDKSRRQLLKRYFTHFKDVPYFCKRRNVVGKSKDFKPCFIGFDYEKIREGAFYENVLPVSDDLVSVIVRTCGRPDVLRENLISIRNQTYKNIEVVIVEDGPDTSKSMIETEFNDLNIIYQATGDKVGRSKVGNIAMGLANGKYLNLLDDDDVFYADHIEVLLTNIQKSNCRVVYSFAFETPTLVESVSPYKYKIIDRNSVHKQAFNVIMLCHHNYLPIQTVMFEKKLFEQFGGFDEKYDALEDWDMWLRYAMHTKFLCVEKTTSEYRVPYNKKLDEKRQCELDEALKKMRMKHSKYMLTISANDVSELYEKK